MISPKGPQIGRNSLVFMLGPPKYPELPQRLLEDCLEGPPEHEPGKTAGARLALVQCMTPTIRGYRLKPSCNRVFSYLATQSPTGHDFTYFGGPLKVPSTGSQYRTILGASDLAPFWALYFPDVLTKTQNKPKKEAQVQTADSEDRGASSRASLLENQNLEQ